MAVAKIHPEDLIDKLVAGTLTRAEEEHLRTHLAGCPTCRFEIATLNGIAEETQAAAEREKFQQEPPAAPARRRSVPPGRRRTIWLLVAAAVLCTGGALAAALSGMLPIEWVSRRPDVPAVGAPDVAPHGAVAQAKRRSTARPGTARRDDTPPAAGHDDTARAAGALDDAPERSAATTALDDPPTAAAIEKTLRPAAAAPARDDARSAGSTASRHATAPGTESVATSRSTAPRAAASFAAATPDDVPRGPDSAALFAEANRVRRDGNTARAMDLYRALQSQFPGSAESQLSRALLARLSLENGNPEEALSGFDRYLTKGSAVLGAEALVGRARALEQLGKRDEAVAAWRAVMRQFPGSVHARLAASRLAALGSR